MSTLNTVPNLYPIYKSIIDVKANDDYTLQIEFDHNEKKILDMQPYLNLGRFKELKSKEKFKEICVSFDSIEWKNGLDLDPEFVYEKSIKIE